MRPGAAAAPVRRRLLRRLVGTAATAPAPLILMRWTMRQLQGALRGVRVRHPPRGSALRERVPMPGETATGAPYAITRCKACGSMKHMMRLFQRRASCLALPVPVQTNIRPNNLVLQRTSMPVRPPRRSGAHAAPERVIMLRGVVWRTAEVELWPLWRDMARCWPTALADGDRAGSQLLAHAGARNSCNTCTHYP